MFIKSFRPQCFSELVGEEVNSKLLLSVAKNRSLGPSTYIFSGEFGSGKSTSSRLFAKILNCRNPKSNDICGKCDVCTCNVLESPFYSEYDSSAMGSVDSVRELRDSFFFKVKGYTRVINLDESHLLSRQAQSALLKVFEETSEGVYFVLSTTDPEKLLPTIRSRSLVLNFGLKSKDLIIKNVKELSDKYELKLTDRAIDIIATRSRGHMRDAHMLIDKCMLLGEEDFINTDLSAYNFYIKYVASIFLKDKSGLFSSIEQILKVPVAHSRDDWQNFLLDLMHTSVDSEFNSAPQMKKLSALLGNRVTTFVKLAMGDWVIKSFDSDVQLQTCLLAIYQIVTKEFN